MYNKSLQKSSEKEYLILNYHSIIFYIENASRQPVQQQPSFVDDDGTDITSTEEDERSVTPTIWLEKLKKTIIDIDLNS